MISLFVNHAVARGLGTVKQPVMYELLALIVFMNGWLRFLFVGIHLDLWSESVRIFHDKNKLGLAGDDGETMIRILIGVKLRGVACFNRVKDVL